MAWWPIYFCPYLEKLETRLRDGEDGLSIPLDWLLARNRGLDGGGLPRRVCPGDDCFSSTSDAISSNTATWRRTVGRFSLDPDPELSREVMLALEPHRSLKVHGVKYGPFDAEPEKDTDRCNYIIYCTLPMLPI